MNNYDVTVIGAGPYGLSVAAHLQARSLKVCAFGRPMQFWDRHMPAGMFLRSPRRASNLSDAEGKLTLANYLDASLGDSSVPTPLRRFVDYGVWFQRRTFRDLDTRNVATLRKNGEFCLTLEDGEEIKASRVVIAAGIGSFAHRPRQFAGLPQTLVTHASEHCDFTPFKNRKVAVIGGGQSALESAALLREAGAEVELLVRSRRIKWLKGQKGPAAIKSIERLLWAWSHVGPAGISHVIARPNYFRMLPRFMQDSFGVLPPAGSAWLRPRVEQKVPISDGCTVVSIKRTGDQLEMIPDIGRQRQVDHVLLATGYRVDISQYAFIAPQLLAGIYRVNGYPRLNSHFESSISGLYFLGAPAAWSFGPLMKFVAGAAFAAKTVTRGIVATSGSRKTEEWSAPERAASPEFQNQEARLP